MVISSRGFTNPVSTRQEVQQESSASWTTGPSLFGTDGIRGRAGQLLSPALALQVGLSAGRVFLKQAGAGAIMLGQDSRNSSDSLAMALAAGLTATGVEVWHLGLCPTPGVAYLTTAAQAIGGVMISASHNPPEDNGIKFFGPDGTKSLDLQQQIEAELQRNRVGSLGVAFGAAGGTSSCEPGGRWGHHYYRPELVHTYLDSLQKPLLNEVNLKGMKIVLDLAWGAAVYSAPEVFRRLGASVVCLHNRPDGDRINVDCGSTHLGPLQAAVQLHGADLGFAFDGDADRVLAVDSQGRTVDGDYILYLWGQTLRGAQQLPGNLIVSTVMANLGFECAWQQSGGELVRTAVGDQYVHAEMQRRNAMLGGEQSGHILCPHYGVSGDGLLTALHLAALVRRAGCTLAELVDQSFQTYPQLLRNVRVENRDRRLNWQNCDALQAAIAQATASMGNQGRILVRASGTEPVIRVMVEACTAELANHWTENLVLAVQQHLAD